EAPPQPHRTLLCCVQDGETPLSTSTASAYFVPCVDSTDGDGLWSNWSDLRQGQSASGRVWAVRGKRNALKGGRKEKEKRERRKRKRKKRGGTESVERKGIDYNIALYNIDLYSGTLAIIFVDTEKTSFIHIKQVEDDCASEQQQCGRSDLDGIRGVRGGLEHNRAKDSTGAAETLPVPPHSDAGSDIRTGLRLHSLPSVPRWRRDGGDAPDLEAAVPLDRLLGLPRRHSGKHRDIPPARVPDPSAGEAEHNLHGGVFELDIEEDVLPVAGRGHGGGAVRERRFDTPERVGSDSRRGGGGRRECVDDVVALLRRGLRRLRGAHGACSGVHDPAPAARLRPGNWRGTVEGVGGLHEEWTGLLHGERPDTSRRLHGQSASTSAVFLHQCNVQHIHIGAVTFPLSTILFTLPWPLLGASTLNRFVILGLAIELSGIVYYQHASSKSARPEESSSTTTNATTGKSAERTYLLTEDQGRSQYDTTLKPDPSALST
ncbi:hypothetical protein THAOC_04395, partial [Thalassiosira oceanica]